MTAAELIEALTDVEIDRVENLTEEWGAEFPQGRFSGRTVETARISISPTEAVELAKRAYALGASLRDCLSDPAARQT